MLPHQGPSFRQAVERLHQQSSDKSVYPRPDLYSLGQYLKLSPTPSKFPNATTSGYLTPSRSSEGDKTSSFAVVHDLNGGSATSFGPSASELTQFANRPLTANPAILFLRGHASPQWLNCVGDKYDINPELFHRHMQFPPFALGDRDLYASPSLPSSSTRVFQLTISTICDRNVTGTPYEPEDLEDARRSEVAALEAYFRRLRSEAQVTDSWVRNCLLFSNREYILEQTISIEVGPSQGDPWRAVVWLDNGTDLARSVEGPWSPRPNTRSWETFFYPIIVHQANSSSGTPAPVRGRSSSSSSTVRSSSAPKLEDPSISSPAPGNAAAGTSWKAAQNICLLPFYYGAKLDRETATQDAVYALSEVFQFAASSELQFLNFIHKRIEHELSFIGQHTVIRHNSVSLVNLRYIKKHLDSHAQRLADVVTILRNRDSLDWPCAPGSQKAQHTARLLLTDFDYLLARAEALARACEHGMDTLGNSSILEEARRSTENAARVHKLTVIATIFIPLSFACSLWGMNFKEFGTGSQPLWLFPVTAAPVLVIAAVIYCYDLIVFWYRKTKHYVYRNDMC